MQPPPPPAAWLAPCPAAQRLPEGLAIGQAEAWGAVIGPDGAVAALGCEAGRRACVRAWYAEALWTRPVDQWPAACRPAAP